MEAVPFRDYYFRVGERCDDDTRVSIEPSIRWFLIKYVCLIAIDVFSVLCRLLKIEKKYAIYYGEKERERKIYYQQINWKRVDSSNDVLGSGLGLHLESILTALFRSLSLNEGLCAFLLSRRKITRNRTSNDGIYDIVDIGQRLLPEVCLNWGEISKKFAGRLALEIFVKMLLDYWRLTLTTSNNVEPAFPPHGAFCYSYKRCVHSLSVIANHERTPVVFFS